MNLKAEEVLAVFIGAIAAGMLLAFIERTFPATGVTTR